MASSPASGQPVMFLGTSPQVDMVVSREQIDSFLTQAGRRFADRCTPERFLALSKSLDLHSVRPEEIFVPTTLIAVEEDAPARVDEFAHEVGPGGCEKL